MKKTVTQGSTTNTTEYLGEFQYLNGTLQFIQHAEGYVKYTAGGSAGFYNYVYHIKDHLGNIRVTFTKQLTNNTAKLLKENHYYPFGLKHSYNSAEFDYYYNTATSSLAILPITNSNRYQYNSKEWQNELNLNLYDYGARMFDPAIGRWGVVDPLAEKFYSWSPYNYVYNNPLKFIDPDGKAGMGAEWYPDPKDNSRLIAEEGDNWKTLSKNWPVSVNEAKELTVGLKKDENGNVVEGQKVSPNNKFTSAIKNTEFNGIFSEIYGERSNCHGASSKGTNPSQIKISGEMSAPDMNNLLSTKYEQVNKNQVIPGQTIIRWGGTNFYAPGYANVTNHTAILYGISSNGTQYAFTVNGSGAKPVIMKVNSISNEENKYGKIQGLNGGSGYYIRK